jgi:hypothetical protein
MKRKQIFTMAAMAFCLQFGVLESRAQSDELPKIELAAEFTSITKPGYNGGATEPGFGGRFTYNLNKSVAVEAAGYFFPHKCQFGPCSNDNNGNTAEGLFGVKAGKRFEKWGIFAKGRPGVISFSQGKGAYIQTGANGIGLFPFQFQQERANHFAFDAGGVLEFYPSKRIVTRFDAGDTLIHYGARTYNYPIYTSSTGLYTLAPFTQRGETRHNFQFAASVGFRF